MNLNGQGSMSVLDSIHPLDIAVDSVSGEIFVITHNGSILSINSLNTVQVVFHFEEVPIALDVFEVFAYVIFGSGSIKQINIHEGSQG